MASDLTSRLRDELGRLLAPLAAAATPRGAADLLAALGRPDRSSEIRSALERLAQLAIDITTLEDAELTSWEGLARLLALSGDLMSSLQGIEDLVTDPDLATQVQGLGRELVELLVGLYVRGYQPRLLRAASLLTLIDPAEQDPPLPTVVEDGVIVRLPWQRDRLRIDRLDDLISDPLGTLEAAYLPHGLMAGADAHEAARRSFPALHELARALGLASSYGPFDPAAPAPIPTPVDDADIGIPETTTLPPEPTEDPPPPVPPDLAVFQRTYFPRFVLALPGLPANDGSPTAARLALAIVVSSAEHPGGVRGLIVTPTGELAWTETRGRWRVAMAAEGQLPAFVIGPDGVSLAPAGSPITGAQARLTIERIAAPGEPAFRLGAATGTRLELGTLQIGLAAEVRPARQAVELSARAGQGALVLAAGDGDGFLRSVLPADGLRASCDFGVILSSEDGLRLEGGAGLTVRFPTMLRIGPVSLDAIELAVIASSSEVHVEATAAVGVQIGPVDARIAGAGLRLSVSAPLDGGNLGPVELDAGFRPPTGVALSIDAGPVTGGGFLFFDPDKEQYAGGLHLELEQINLDAIGLLTTRLPDGSRGFSLLVIVRASGFTPIQLGFGFTLNGIGGLLGIHRTVAVDVLRAGVRDRTLDAILFSPDDPTPRAPQIVSTLQTVFPPAANQYVFGPMALFGWGAPVTLITIEIALVLELPSPLRLIVLGRVRAALPDAAHPIVSINCDVVGVIDFDRRELSVDASLYDSRVGPFALSGDMAARASWGERADFAMALGGFHPAFKPPPGFPALRRLALALSTGNNPRLRMEAYFALTSNTVQVGARLELYIGIAGFALEGGLAFDTLIQFSPFRLLADIRAHLALKRGRTTLMGIELDVHLSGPAPWVLWGRARFKIFIISFSIPFRATFGRAEDVPAIERQDVWPILRDSLGAAGNWSAQLPPESGRMVVIRADADAGAGDPLAHPLGTLTVSENLVPLERTLGLFGSVPPRDYDCFAIVGATGLAIAGATTQPFAPAQFRKMSDAEKLASPSFERMVSGARLAPTTAIVFGYVQETPLDYEQSVILDVDQPASERFAERYTPTGTTVAALAEHGPAGTAEVRTQGRRKFAPKAPGPAVAEPTYVVVTKDELTPVALDGHDGSYTSAAERLRRRADRDALQIVRAEELELT